MTPYLRKAQYYETDQMGIIHHSNYIRWFEEARVDFLEQIGYGYQKAMACGVDFALLSLSCDYKSMVRFGDTVSISMEITELGAARMTIHYIVVDAYSCEVRATGYTSHCYYDKNLQRPVSLKKAMPELFRLFESIMVNNDGQL